MDKRLKWSMSAILLVIVLVVVASWIAGGPEELHEISQPVPVPELPQ